MPEELRKTRFVCLSDTHNASPEDGAFKLPKGDVLVHAGDLTKQGTFAELKRTLDWIEKADFEVKLIVAGSVDLEKYCLSKLIAAKGNHDVTLDREFYTEYGGHFHNQHPQDPEVCIKLVKEYTSITFLNNESASIRLVKEDGPRTSFRVFGSPYSPRHGLWAFGYTPERASELWDQIPLDSDVVITHTPPKYHCDESGTQTAIGCDILRQTLWRVRPSLVVCGHVHEGRGAQRVLWDLSSPNIKFKEVTTGYWEDPGHDNKKQCLLDLSRKGPEPLQNTGPIDHPAEDARRDALRMMSRGRSDAEVASEQLHATVCGQGGTPPSGRCDIEALDGRLGKKETCIVNAAIMASSWPYKTNAGRKYNKPIVVDLDLPVWKNHDEAQGGEVLEDLDTSSTKAASFV